MRLSTKARYAVRAMVDLAQHDGAGTVTRDEIAERQAISPLYLSHILLKLGKAELVSSVKGPGGGYQLSRPAGEIRIGDIVRAVGEPLDLVGCVDAEHSTCARVDRCAAHDLWVQLSQVVSDTLDSVTLLQLTERENELARVAPVEMVSSAVGDLSQAERNGL